MGKPVTVDSDDLEVLLNAAVGMQMINNALNTVREDPAMRRIFQAGSIGQALDRLNKARAHAIREIEYVDRHAPARDPQLPMLHPGRSQP